LLKTISKILMGLKGGLANVKQALKKVHPVKYCKAVISPLAKLFNWVNFGGLLKNPLFYFGLASVLMFGVVYTLCDSSIGINGLDKSNLVCLNSFFNRAYNVNGSNLFSSQSTAVPLETPDLKIMQDNTLCGVSTPSVVNGKVLGDVFGSNDQNKKDVINYDVQPGDTLQSIADS